MTWAAAPAREALASLLEGLQDVQATHAYGPSVTALPAVVVSAPYMERGNGLMTMDFPVHVLVARAGMQNAERQLDELVEKVASAIEADQTWGGTVRAASVRAVVPGETGELFNLEHYGATLTCRALVPCP